MQTDKEEHSITTYVSDMLALERHIRVPFNTQEKDDDLAKYPDARHLVTRLVALADNHIEQLDSCLDSLGGHEASGVKSAVTQFEGAVAGAIDKMRKTKISKALRDDYTALSLCAAGYTALLATANALGEQRVATLAESLLQDYTTTIIEIGSTLPGIVVLELRDTGLNVDESTIETTREQLLNTWHTSSAQSRNTRTGTTAGTASGSTQGTIDSSRSTTIT
jgi:ferritin-like metal-binding protein YciE